jgi:hypothetical protein
VYKGSKGNHIKLSGSDPTNQDIGSYYYYQVSRRKKIPLRASVLRALKRKSLKLSVSFFILNEMGFGDDT